MLLAGVQPFLARPALADGLVKKIIETGNLTTFQKSAQKEAFRVSRILSPITGFSSTTCSITRSGHTGEHSEILRPSESVSLVN